ncbi:hypothetical protein VTH06DRAFT_2065 [Thermothelomyces fergusii]
MGLLRLISKKRASRRKAGASTASANSPESRPSQTAHPQDGSAVADDPRAEGPLSGVPVGFNQSEFSFETGTADEQPAPPPNVPRFREEDAEGLGTAGNDHQFRVPVPREVAQAKGHEQRRPPPLSFRIARTESGTSTSCPSSRGSMGTIEGVFSRNSGQLRAEAPRTNNRKAFKDLLDAQSEIKPTDFKARVAASGARDYGEDVADRNLGQNGFDLSSEHVRAFYAQARRAESQQAGHLAGTKKLDPYKAGVRRITPCTSQPSLSRNASGSASSSNSSFSRKQDAAHRHRSASTDMALPSGKRTRAWALASLLCGRTP